MASLGDRQNRYALHYAAVLYRLNEMFNAGDKAAAEAIARFEVEYPNMAHARQWAADNATRDLNAAELCQNFPHVGNAILNTCLPPAERLKWSEEALSAARFLEDEIAEMHSLGYLGNSLVDLGRNAEAVGSYLDQTDLAERLNDLSTEFSACNMLCSVFTRLGQTESALRYAKRQREIAGILGDDRLVAVAEDSAGIIQHVSGGLAEAISSHQKLLQKGKQAKDNRIVCDSLLNLSLAHCSLGEVDKAIRYAEEGIGVARELRDELAECKGCNCLADAYYNNGDYSKASEAYEKSFRMGTALGSLLNQAISTNGTGNVLYVQNEVQKARRHYADALRIVTIQHNFEKSS